MRPQLLRSVGWNALAAVCTAVIQWLQLLLLARSLPAADFGPMAVLSLLFFLGYLLTDLGLSTNVQRLPDMPAAQLGALARLSAGAGLLWALLLYALAPWLAAWVQQPGGAGLFRFAALYFVLIPLGLPFQAQLLRDMQFKIIGLTEVFSWLVSLLVSVAGALQGWGIWALPIAYLTKTMVQNGLLLLVGWRRYGFPWLQGAPLGDCLPMLRYGLFEAGSQGLSTLAYHLDQLLLGHFLGMQALGWYYLARQISVVPVSRINPLLTRVLLPFLGKIQQDPVALQQWLQQGVRWLMLFNLPLLLGLALSAPTLTPLLLGPENRAVAPVLQVLCVAALPVTLANATVQVFFVRGRSDLVFYWNLGLCCTVAAMQMLFLQQYPQAMVAARVQAAIAWLGFPLWCYLLLRAAPLQLGGLARALRTPLYAAFPMGIWLLLVAWLFPAEMPWIKGFLEITGAMLLYAWALKKQRFLTRILS
jgi:O-antigen/teichoic acid export membrane protein